MSDPVDTRRWHRADEIFTAALELPVRERARLLAARCGDDELLRRRVERLLRASAEADGMLDGSDHPMAMAIDEALDEVGTAGSAGRVGSHVGKYRLRARLGRGGMADVYLAERVDGGFRQRVAVKILRRGLDTDDLLRRFRAERQILSDLQHPNIARLIDGGATEDGLPYLVMEYVDGSTITEYCERHRLPVADRVRLVVEVTRAVQAAHAQLIVHRDIKPSNILVTPDGRVRLLDFGIAKLLDPAAGPDEAPPTRTGFRPLTPEYASPEQVLGRPITTASDIYQLGLLLYRLLAGGRPYGVAETDRRSLETAITATEPSRPSVFVGQSDRPLNVGLDRGALARRLRGDLDTIVLKALRKEPERRYASADGLADDLLRHLDGRPIAAREESRVYRTRKFFQRHRWVAPAAASVVAGAGLYVGALVQHGRELETERNAARLEAAKARTAQEFLVGLFRSADPFAPAATGRSDIRVSEVMEEGVLRARAELENQPELQTAMLGTIGDVFLALGDSERAVSLRREAYETAERSFGPDSPEAAIAYRELIEPTIQWIRREPVPTDSAVVLGVDALRRIRTTHPEADIEVTRAKLELANAMLYGNLFATGEVIAREAVGRLADGEHPVDRARGLMILSRLLVAQGRWPEAEGTGREGIEAFAEAFGRDHVQTWAMRLWISRVLPPAEGDSLRRAAIEAFEAQLGPHHEMTIRAYGADASIRNQRGDYAAASDAYWTVLQRRLERGDDPANGWFVVANRSFADAARTAGRYSEAAQAYRAAFDGASGADLAPSMRASILARLGWTLVDLGRPAEALATTAESHRMLGTARPDALMNCTHGRALRANGRDAEADSVTAEALAEIERTGYVLRDYHPCWGLSAPSAVVRTAGEPRPR